MNPVEYYQIVCISIGFYARHKKIGAAKLCDYRYHTSLAAP